MRDLDLLPRELIASPTTFDVVLHHRSVFSPKDEEWPKNSGRSPTQVLHETQEAATRTVGINAHSGKLDLDGPVPDRRRNILSFQQGKVNLRVRGMIAEYTEEVRRRWKSKGKLEKLLERFGKC